MTEESIFSREKQVIDDSDSIAGKYEVSGDPLLPAYLDLLSEYKKLFRQTKRLVKMSDRMQKNLNELNAELQTHKEILSKMSYLDGLTSIANRRHFNEYIESEWNRSIRTGRPLSMILLDIDFFKQYNDNYGHKAGDDCLINVARALSAAVKRSSDLAARYGGEEFSVLLPETGLSGAMEVASEVQNNIEKAVLVHEYSPVAGYITVSIGVVSVVPDAEHQYQELIEAADQQLYAAKEAGRNQVKGRVIQYDARNTAFL